MSDHLAGLLRSPAERAEAALMLVVGPSGCGKSSLVRAGLQPMMATEPGWAVLPAVLPGAHPVAALTRNSPGSPAMWTGLVGGRHSVSDCPRAASPSSQTNFS